VSRFKGKGFSVYGFKFRVEGAGVGVQNLRYRGVQGPRYRI
jgi:hypothetical protein